MSDNQEMDLYYQSKQSIKKFVQAGYYEEALKMVGALLQAYPEKEHELIRIKADTLLEVGREEEAIISYIELYEIFEDNDAYELIVNSFVEPRKQVLNELFLKNINYVKETGNYYGEINGETSWYAFYQGEDLIIALDYASKTFKGYKKKKADCSTISDCPILIEDAVFYSQIREIAELSKFKDSFNGIEHAVYLAYEENDFLIFLQCGDMKSSFYAERYFFIVGTEGIYNCFLEEDVVLPTRCINLNQSKSRYSNSIEIIANEITNKCLEKIRLVDDYYSDSENIINLEKRVREGRPRILFATSRFTTALQYHCRDSMMAAERQGCECMYLIEKDAVRRSNFLVFMNALDTFHPDVFFSLDHFRFEQIIKIPDPVFFTSWIQDPLPNILDPKTKDKLLKRDVLFNHIFTWDGLQKLYPGMLEDAPIPANSEIYKVYQLTEQEKEIYSCDICFVCHSSDVNAWALETAKEYKMNDNLCELFKNAVKKYREIAGKGTFFFSVEKFKEFYLDYVEEEGWILPEDVAEVLAEESFKFLNQRVFRQVLVQWIVGAGFTNIKLWGNGWKKETQYEKFAMGPAENGETLSKIYQASKIVVGNNIMTTGAARAWESMLSGAFYLSNYIPEEVDWCDLRKILPEGTVEFFRDKEELIQKLHYYLDHEEERKEMARKGREATLERMTYDVFMKKYLEVLRKHVKNDTEVLE